jgi:hypothetical protein
VGPPFPYTKIRVNHPAVEPVVRRWAARNGCAITPAVGRAASDASGHTATELVFGDCATGYGVVHWKLTGAGHVWPGGTSFDPEIQRHLGAATSVISANEEIWRFFRRYSRADAPPLTGRRSAPPRPARALRAEDVVDRALLDVAFDRSAISLSATGAAPRDVSDLMGEYGERSLRADAAVSLYSRARVNATEPSLVRIQAQLAGEIAAPKVDFLQRDGRFYKASVGVTGFYLSPGSNLYALYLGAAIAEEDATISSPTALPLALGFGTYRLGDSLAIVYGAGFTYAFGRGVALPLLGAMWRPSERWSLSALLPLVAGASYRVTDDLQLGVRLAVDGDQFRFANEGLFPGERDELTMRLAAGKLALHAIYRISRDLQLRAEVGALGPRRIRFTDGDREIAESEIASGGFVTASVRYAFGSLPLGD